MNRGRGSLRLKRSWERNRLNEPPPLKKNDDSADEGARERHELEHL